MNGNVCNSLTFENVFAKEYATVEVIVYSKFFVSKHLVFIWILGFNNQSCLKLSKIVWIGLIKSRCQ